MALPGGEGDVQQNWSDGGPGNLHVNITSSISKGAKNKQKNPREMMRLCILKEVGFRVAENPVRKCQVLLSCGFSRTLHFKTWMG
jgi:hypothetical protein